LVQRKKNWDGVRLGPVSTEKGFVIRNPRKKGEREGRGCPGRPTQGGTGKMLIGGKAKPSRQ